MPPRKKIAIVDDMADNRLIVRSVLEDDFEIRAYEDGPSALASLPDDLPDLVLLDICMPVMDGFEVLRHMRSDPRLADLLIVAFTSAADPAEAPRYRELGFDEFLGKPVLDPVQMISDLHTLLAS